MKCQRGVQALNNWAGYLRPHYPPSNRIGFIQPHRQRWSARVRADDVTGQQLVSIPVEVGIGMINTTRLAALIGV
jgi:hypothetical protein